MEKANHKFLNILLDRVFASLLQKSKETTLSITITEIDTSTQQFSHLSSFIKMFL